MYKFCDSVGEYISTHDCHVTKISYENGIVTFVFPDGIWITEEHPSNTTGKTVRTSQAEMQFSLEWGVEEDVTVYVFEEKFSKTIREGWALSKLMEYVNSGKHTLEFLYEYKGYQSMILECVLWSDEKPYYKECELKVSLKDVKYCWNALCEDWEW